MAKKKKQLLSSVAQITAAARAAAASVPIAKPTDDEGELLWGAAAIGKVIGRTASQVRYLHSIGFFGPVVWKAGAKTLVGSRRGLQAGGDYRQQSSHTA